MPSTAPPACLPLVPDELPLATVPARLAEAGAQDLGAVRLAPLDSVVPVAGLARPRTATRPGAGPPVEGPGRPADALAAGRGPQHLGQSCAEERCWACLYLAVARTVV